MIILILNIRILIKLGAAPFHAWIPKIISVISWNNNILFMTWQKIAPIYLLNTLDYNSIIDISVIISVIVGSLGGLYQTSLRKIMAYSSINHLGWIITLTKIKDNWIIYITIYRVIIITIGIYLSNKKLIFINQLFNINITNLQKINFSIIIIRLGGIPPILGFIPKWIVIEELITNKSNIIILFIIITRIITLFYYIRISFKLIILNSINNKWMYYKDKYSAVIFIINILIPLIILIY